jgi:hypothetical protein
VTFLTSSPARPNPLHGRDTDLALLLFAPPLAFSLALADSVDAQLVDLETHGKVTRQLSYDTQINRADPNELNTLAQRLPDRAAVRINPWLGRSSQLELERVLAAGARLIMLPMAESALDGRALSIVQVETMALLQDLPKLSALPWDHVYLGCNDLMVQRGDRDLFRPLVDGTVARLASTLRGRSYGMLGLTRIGYGTPIPTLEIAAALVHFGCQLTVLRRSFMRDTQPAASAQAVADIRSAIANLRQNPNRRTALWQQLSRRLQPS